MAKRDRLTAVSVKIGKALGKAEKQARRRARQFDEATKVTKEELQAISKQVDVLKKQLAKTTVRLKKVLSS
jgi:ABC-type Fe2+-enterobactin transport system substrate-binding protein